jgi:hypothetical protein
MENRYMPNPVDSDYEQLKKRVHNLETFIVFITVIFMQNHEEREELEGRLIEFVDAMNALGSKAVDIRTEGFTEH